MTFSEINAVLAQIRQELRAIDLTKEDSVKTISKMVDKPIADVDKITHDKGFTKDHLTVTVDTFKSASEAINKWDSNKEYEKAIGSSKKRSQILSGIQAKKAVQQKVKGKYEELSRKQAVIDKYKEKFDPEHLVIREKRKFEVNDKRMQNNENRIRETMDFKERVNEELNGINNNLTLIRELNELQKQSKKLEDAKADFNAEKAKPNADKDFIKQYQLHIQKQEAQFKDKYEGITQKYTSIKLDPNNLKSSIQTAKNNAKTNIDSAKTSVAEKLNGAENKYGYTSGFETFINDKISSAKGDKEYIEVFDHAIRELATENINLDLQNEKIMANMDTIREGQQVIRSGKAVNADKEPTEDEIQNVIENDPEIRALAPVLSKKETRRAVYDELTKDKRGRIHPILFLKSFGKKAKAEWQESYESEMKKVAIEKIKDEKSENAKSAGAIESKRQKFMDLLVTHVMNADNKSVEQMDKNAEKAPGKVLSEIYDEMQKDDDGAR